MDPHDKHTGSPKGPDNNLDLKQYNVLYVDDEPNNLLLFKASFQREFNIITAESGQDGLQILSKKPIHLIVTDQKMPKMTGMQFLKKVKKKWPYLKFILLTGFFEHDVITEAINEVGIYCYLNKPMDLEQMKTLMTKGLESYQLEMDKNYVDQQLRDYKLRYEQFLSSAIDGIVIIDDELTIMTINPAITRMFGYKEEQLVGHPASTLLPGVFDHEIGNDYLNISAKNGQNEYIPVEVAISTMELNSKKVYCAIIRDIHRRPKT